MKKKLPKIRIKKIILPKQPYFFWVGGGVGGILSEPVA